MQRDDIEAMQDAIRALHGCEADDLGRVTHVREMFRGEVAWEGQVRHFRLIDHPRARKVAENIAESKTLLCVAIRGRRPVDSPQTAVKMAIAAKAKSR